MRRVSLQAPFTGGMVTDIPAHGIGPQHSAFAQDGYSPRGLFRQRKGWQYDGTTADVADDLVTVWRNKFVLADVTRTVTGDDDGDLFIHNAAAAGTSIFSGSVEYLARAVYNDELLFCAQDGESEMVRYSGSSLSSFPITASGTMTYTQGEATLSGGTWSATPDVGSFLSVVNTNNDAGALHIRILSSSTSTSTLEGIRNGSTLVPRSEEVNPYGVAYPCVSVYDAGTMTVSSNTATGYGTKWADDYTNKSADMVLILSGSSASHGFIDSDQAITNTSMAVNLAAEATKRNYRITRACPFTDVAAHKSSLWGTGNAVYPNRVYVGPPGWNISFPPGFTLPFDASAGLTSSNANDFLMDFIDVPSPFDGDANVAILTSPGPLLVLKRHAVYGLFGSYGGISVDLIADGIGCIDIRSAWSYDEGQFWAGESGIYWYVNGEVRDLTAGKINRDWRQLTEDFDYGTSDYCSLGLVSGHLVVHITTGGGVTQRTYLCDLRDQSWQSRLTNVNARCFFTSRVSGEDERCYFVSDDDQGRVMDLAPAFDGTGTAKDDDGTSPRLQARTTSAMGQADGVSGLTNLVDLDVHANVYDAGAAGSTSMSVSVVSGGGVANEADSTKTLSAINSDTEDRIDRHHYRVGRRGRLHQVRLDADTLGTDDADTLVEVAQIDAFVRDGRRRS